MFTNEVDSNSIVTSVLSLSSGVGTLEISSVLLYFIYH